MARIPWATLLLAAVCLVGPLWKSEPAAPPVDADTARLLIEEAARWWRVHPWLSHVPQLERVRIELAAGEVTPMPDEPAMRAAMQEELDRLTREALEQALTPAEPSAPTRLERWGVSRQWLTPLRLLAHPLLSPGWILAAGHVFVLLLVAVLLEARLGYALFAMVALAGATFTACVHALVSAPVDPPLVGTAGAIAGLLGAFFAVAGRERVALPLSSRTLPAGALLAGGIAVELLLPWMVMEAGAAAIARRHLGQIAGFVFGAASLLGLPLTRLVQRRLGVAAPAASEPLASPPAPRETSPARQQQTAASSLPALEKAWRRDPRDADLALLLWETALREKQAARGGPAMAGLVAQEVAAGEEAAALEHWLDLTERVPGARVEPAALLRLVPLLQQRGFAEAAVRALRSCVDPASTALPAGLALRAADLARELDPASARRAARRALEFTDLHEGKRERMRTLLAELGEEVAPPVAPALRKRAIADELEAFEEQPRFNDVSLVDGVPVAIEFEVLRLRLAGGRKARVSWASVDAIAVAAVRGLGPKPVLVIDLLLNWSSFEEGRLRVIRLRSNAFDPRSLFPGAASSLDALRSLVDEMLQRTGAMALPDVQAAYGRPFRVFDDIQAYQREVLEVGG